MKKTKHNKKRNTAFVYEALVREATACILKEKKERQRKIIRVLKKHFKHDSALKRDLECYRSLYEHQNLTAPLCERVMHEVKVQKQFIDPKGLFEDQSALIRDINRELGSSLFDTFVPNYKTLATISQIFSPKTSPKSRVLLESEIVRRMAQSDNVKDTRPPLDKLVYSKFVEKFNTKYEKGLLEEQKTLLGYYISSFSDNSLELKIYLNEEIGRLKQKLSDASTVQEMVKDSNMQAKRKEVLNKLNSFASAPISEEMLLTIMRTQSLIKEIYLNADNN